MKPLFSFLILFIAAPAAFAWPAFSETQSCHSQSLEIQICHSAAQADGGTTAVRSVKLNGKDVPVSRFDVHTDSGDSYDKATVVFMKAESSETPTMTVILADGKNVKESSVILRTQQERGVSSTKQEALTCGPEQPDNFSQWCGNR